MLHIDTSRRDAHWQGLPLALSDRAFDLLVLLASRPGELVASQQLQRALWPGRHVDPANLRVHISALRRQLGSDALRTVAGRGYMLTLPVAAVLPSTGASAGAGARPLTGTLPLPPDLLIGREACLQHLNDLLQAHRLVCLLGPGGIGKTRVALQLALHQRDQSQALPGGLLWVDLAPLPAAQGGVDRLCQAVADAGGLQQAAAGASDDQAALRLGQVIRQATGEQAALLVLDNAEHLITPLAAMLPRLLGTVPGLRVLVTSQHALPLTLGQACWLPLLDVPPADAGNPGIQASPAVQLLLRRAQAVHPQWQPAADDWPAIGALARALDGLALALELAAVRLPLVGAQALQSRLSDRLRQLQAQARDVPARQRTLQAALDWSYALLTQPEQVALGQLAVFAAPFRLTTALRCLHIDALDEAGLELVVQGLVQRSMLQLQPAGPQGAPARLRMAQTTRLYALQALQARGTEALRHCEKRHGQALAELALRAGNDFYDMGDEPWSARWLPDLEDLQVAFDRAHDRGDADVAADIIEAMVLATNITGRLDPVLQRWQATRTLAEQAAPLARAKLLGWGNMAHPLGTSRREQSEQRVQAWLGVPGDAGRRGRCLAWAMHAVVCQDGGDAQAADAALAECLALESPEWPPRLRRRCGWIALSRLAVSRDDDALLQRAERLSVRMVAELQHQGAWRELTLVQVQLSRMLRLRGRWQAAAALLEQTAATQLQLGCGLDAGRSLGLQCAALAELLDAAEAAGQALNHQLLHQACAVAHRALALSEPFPLQVTHFGEALAGLACCCDEAELAAQLLAGTAQLRLTQQAANDRLTERAGQRAWQRVHQSLDPALTAHCVHQGQALTPDAWRQLALRWLSAPVALVPAGGMAEAPPEK